MSLARKPAGEGQPRALAPDRPLAGTDAGLRRMSRDLLRERARAAIRDAIAAGRLRPGDQIVEATMAAEIGVSRSPVREALRELEQHGLVVSIPNRGTFVAELDAEDVDEVILLRAALEGLAARLAADRMGRRDVRVLEEIVERMRRFTGAGSDDRSRFSEADAEFHSALVRFSGHKRLQRLWSELDPFIWLLTISRAAGDDAADLSELAEEHARVLRVVASGDPEESQSAIWHHIVRRRATLPPHWPVIPAADSFFSRR